ncbi:MAG TPA: RusA family crossover junction endodeoxyribonuclease [Kofleriaceae bacterium]|nr:RusA family crossover junction endodeoxyribonuclease [Kofleriaceae bacterium]
MIAIEVLGEPAPKGSMRAMLVKGRPVMIPGGTSANQRKLRAWTRAIQERVEQQLGARTSPLYVDQPLSVMLLFKLPRPAGHFGSRGQLLPTAPAHPMAQKDDIDKLARAVLDALKGLLYDDDGRIAVLQCEKQWGDPANEGVVISIETLARQQALAIELGDA